MTHELLCDIFRYIMLLYEDIATNPIKAAKLVYSFLGMTYNEQIENRINYYIGQTNATISYKSKSEYVFSTLRNASFQHDHWKNDLTKRVGCVME